jgi:hypothetical protein
MLLVHLNYSCNCLDGLKKTMKSSSRYTLPLDQDLNPESLGSSVVFSVDSKPNLYGAGFKARGQVRMQRPLQCHYLRSIKLQT